MSETTIYDRLAAAQKAVKNPKADAKAKATPTREYPYATLANVLDIVRPACTEQGLFLSQRLGGNRTDMHLITSVSCGTQRIVLDSFPLTYAANPQQFGSAVTYARRYSLISVFGISSNEEDDDGATSAQETKPPTKRKATAKQKALGDEMRKAKSAGLEVSDLKAWIKQSFWHDLEHLTDDELDVCINHIEGAITDARAPEVSPTDIPF